MGKPFMIGSTFAYTGAALLITGLMLTARPVAAIGVPTRPRGMLVAVVGVLLAAISLAAPAFTSRVTAVSSRLDDVMPEWQFHEFHERHIAAPPVRVYRALRQVRADEIRFFTTLTWIRRFGRPAPPGIMNAGQEPIIDVALKGGFVALADEAPRELVVGTVVAAPPGPRPARTPELLKSPPPGYVIATMNFLVRPDGAGGSWVSTETRVRATSPPVRRVFAAYWRVIYPGSALIRRMWLSAIARRAMTD